MVVESHLSVPLEVTSLEASARIIDWELLIVDTDAVTTSVEIGEETGLEDWVCRRFDSGRHAGGAEGSLLDFREIIDAILVEDELANLPALELLLRPNMGEIEYIPSASPRAPPPTWESLYGSRQTTWDIHPSRWLRINPSESSRGCSLAESS